MAKVSLKSNKLLRVFQTVRKEMDNFYKLYAKWRGGISDDLVWGNIRPLPETMLQVTTETARIWQSINKSGISANQGRVFPDSFGSCVMML